MISRDRIGLFDSGLGGLTVMRAIHEKCPQESLIYFGDTARVPYGNKSPETIRRYSVENSIFLMEREIKALVIACNTASAYAVKKVRSILNIPVIDVIEPGAEKAASVTQSKKIAVLGTKGTIQSGAYQEEIHKRVPGAEVMAIPCPLLVPLVEERFLNHPATELILKEYLKPILRSDVDTVLLGCTHYPVLKHLIAKELGKHIHIVDSATTCAERLYEILKKYEIETREQTPSLEFYVSDDPVKFKDIGPSFFGAPISHVESITQPAWA